MTKLKRFISMALALALILCMLPAGAFAAEVSDDTQDEVNYFALMRAKYREMAIGGSYDPDDPDIQGVLTSINDTAQALWDRMNKDAVSNAIQGSYKSDSTLDKSKDYIFEELPLGNGNSSNSDYITETFKRLKNMTMAYVTKGCELYNNKELLKDILWAVDFVCDNHCLAGYPSYGNWFPWKIGIPAYLGEIVLVLYDELTEEQIQKYGAIMTDKCGTSLMTGANATWCMRSRIYAAMLLEDESWAALVQSQLPKVLGYTTSGDGYYTDGTFIQHDYFPYTGGYGLMCFGDSTYLAYLLDDTPWAIDEANMDFLYQVAYDSYIPIVYEGLCMDAYRGREITRTDTTQPGSGLIITNTLLMLAETADAETAADFKGYIKNWYSSDTMLEEANNGADTAWYKFPVDTVAKILAIRDDKTIEEKSLAGTNIQMSTGARTIHNAEDYTFVISMFTDGRIKSYETMDGNNMGWYTANGMTYLYNADVMRYDGLQKPTLDWYRLPGATSVYGKKQSTTTNLNSFVGGVTSGEYGVTGMDLSVSANSLKAKKSWFMFDDEVVALGTGVSGTGQVETTLENYMLSEDNRTYSINGEEQTMAMDGVETTAENVQTLHIQGNVSGSDMGFYFPNGTALGLVSGTRTGTWTEVGAKYNTDSTEQSAEYFTVWQPHGTDPTDGSYAYVLLPGMSSAQTESYASDSDITILRQDEDVHAVYEATKGMVGANIWAEDGAVLDAFGVSKFLSTDAPASVLMQETDEKLSLYISDPTWENSEITVKLNRAGNYAVADSDKVEVVCTSPYVELKINTSGAKGESFAVEIYYEGEVELTASAIQSAKMVDDALVVSFDAVGGADYYTVDLSVDGQVVKTVKTLKTTCNIYGVSPGETYDVTVTAHTDTTDGPVSESIAFTVPATTSFVDEFEDFSKLYAYSNNYGGWLENKSTIAGLTDKTHLQKNITDKSKSEDLTYYLPNLQDFKLTVAAYNNSYGTINLYTSTDGKTWTEQAYTTSGTLVSQWADIEIVPSGSVNEDANYLKVEIGEHPTKTWGVQPGRFEATLGSTCDEKLLNDSLQTDGNLYIADNAVFDSIDADGTVISPAEGETAELVYSWTNIQDLNVKAWTKKGATVTFETSADGVNYSELIVTAEAGTADESGYTPVTYTVDSLENVHYIRIKLSGDIYVGEAAMHYRPDNTPIQHIRFADSSLDGVISYDVTPEIKVAPMNGASTLIYSSDDKEIASFSNGVAKFIQQGTTNLRVCVEGSDVEAVLPVCVYKNVALNQSATASTSASWYPVKYALDANLVTRWQSNTKSTEWYQINLGELTTFDAIDIQWYSNGKDYNILASKDGVDWTTLKEVTGQTTNGYVRFAFDEPVTAQYIKLQGVSESEYSFFEFRALQREEVEIEYENDINLALNKELINYDDGPETSMEPNMVNDGNMNTRWATARNDTPTFTIDLSNQCEINTINIYWENNGTTTTGGTYKIEVSADGENWQNVVESASSTVAGETHSFDEAITGRYVRFAGIKRNSTNTKYGYSIFEFEVIGKPISEVQEVTFIDLEDSMELLPS